jgi:hypothetical protein
MSLTGSCFCGAVKYAIEESFVGAQSCHCSRCRKVFSGAGSAFAFLADDGFRWTLGESSLSRYASGEGWEIGFCGTCGSTLCGIHEGEVRGVTLGSVDGDPGVQIERHIYVGSKAPWDHIGGSAPQFEEGPG